MTGLVDFKAVCNKLLKSKYPELPVYGIEDTDGLDRPSFFTELIDHSLSYDTKNFASRGLSFKITYFQKTVDEVDQLRKVDEIRDLFGMYITVGKRAFTIREYSYEYIGESNNILQITLAYDFKEHLPHIEDAPIMTDVFTKTEIKK